MGASEEAKPGGKFDKLKARIVAKGFTQREGIDYEETFSPTVRFESVRLMVAAAAADGLHTHQMDVTTAFLYASLDVTNDISSLDVTNCSRIDPTDLVSLCQDVLSLCLIAIPEWCSSSPR